MKNYILFETFLQNSFKIKERYNSFLSILLVIMTLSVLASHKNILVSHSSFGQDNQLGHRFIFYQLDKKHF